MITPLFPCTMTPPAFAAAANLLVNGDFEQPGDDVPGWQIKFDQPGESWYFDNHQYVSVVKTEAGRRNVLRLNVATQFLADNPGVKVESAPIPVKPGGRYRLSGYARSTGPNLRLMCEGYKWRAEVTPHPKPTIYELRKTYRGALAYFGAVKAGGFSGLTASTTWKHATSDFPEGPMGELQQKLFNEVQFLVVHIVAIGGTKGEVFVDDVTLERLNP